nr:unnamed protein product [Callosobruchus chinensis]
MAPDVDVCKLCEDNYIVNSKSIKCDLCDLKFHTSCASINNNCLKYLSENDNLLWICDGCKGSVVKAPFKNNMEATVLEKEIECLRRELDLVTKRISDLEYTTDLQKTIIKSYDTAACKQHNDYLKAGNTQQPGSSKYSDVVKSVPHNSSVLIVKGSTNGCNSDDIIQDLVVSVNPVSKNICINGTRKIRNGVAVHCKDEQSLSALKGTLDEKFGDKFQINEAKKFNPRLLIIDASLKGLKKPDDIVSNILTLNGLGDIDSSDIKFITKLDHEDSVDIVIEVSPTVRNILLKLGKLFLGWKRSLVVDHVRVVKCLNCCSFGHRANECKSDLVCPRCTRKHKLKECKSSDLQCINCLNYNKTYKKNLETNHSANFGGCLSRKIFVDHLKTRNNFDIAAITETWLNDNITDNAVHVDGYQFFRNDRTWRGGGVGLYVGTSFTCSLIDVNFSFQNSLELLCCRLKVCSNSCLVIVVYRPPHCPLNDCIQNLDNILSFFTPQYDNIILLGDLNVDLLNINNILNTCFDSYGFIQIIDEPTRVTRHSSTLIDVIYVSKPDLVMNKGTMNVAHISDHKLVFCELSTIIAKKQVKFITYRDLKNVNIDAFKNCLSTINFDLIYYTQDIDVKVALLSEMLKYAFDLHAPVRTARVTKNAAPWLTPTLSRILKQRDTAANTFQQNPNDTNWENYKSMRNYAVASIRREKKAYLSHLSNLNSGSDWKKLQNLNVGIWMY